MDDALFLQHKIFKVFFFMLFYNLMKKRHRMALTEHRYHRDIRQENKVSLIFRGNWGWGTVKKTQSIILSRKQISHALKRTCAKHSTDFLTKLQSPSVWSLSPKSTPFKTHRTSDF